MGGIAVHFADRLRKRMDDLGSRLVVGIDPDPRRLFAEDSLFRKAYPGMSKDGLLDEFCEAAVEAAQDTACAVKPQSAFFEALGVSGIRSLAKCVKLARSKGIPVIMDGKRGDIGNTAAAYAAAYLDPSSELAADALTVNPYLGPDTLGPFVNAVKQWEAGLFILVKTSNPGSGVFQDAELQSGGSLFMKVAEVVGRLAEESTGACGYSDVGAVVGATYPEELPLLRRTLPACVFLVPGYGAQGGTAEDVRGAFNEDGYGAVVSSSRGIIFAYERLGERADRESIREAMHRAAVTARDDLRSVTPSI